MTAMQCTFGEQAGLPDRVAPARLPSDLMECSDGVSRSHSIVNYDVGGNAHADHETAHESSVQIVTDFLDEYAKGQTAYYTENEDYPAGYSHIVDEMKHGWKDTVIEWVEAELDEEHEKLLPDLIVSWKELKKLAEKVGERVWEELDASECELEYTPHDYACYNGNGCCLYSDSLGEVEDEIPFDYAEVLAKAHEQGILDDILDDVNADCVVDRNRRREKNEETGRYEFVGRETYRMYQEEPYGITIYHCPGGQWQFIVPQERMRELIVEAIKEETEE